MSTAASNSPIQDRLDLPPLDQVGFVVPNLEHAMAAYGPLFGPWNLMDADVDNADFRGQKHSCKMKMAFGKTGDIEIELIELTEGSSPHSEFIDQGGNGMHHLRFRTPDIDNKIVEAKKIGYEPIWYKRLSDDIAFCYLEKSGEPLIIEFLQMP